jgi:hypothetical protein
MEDQQIASHAEKKMDEVAAFILKKVVTQWLFQWKKPQLS